MNPEKKPVLGIFGSFQNGKSTLVNGLLDGRWAATGQGLATTRVVTRYRFGHFDQATAFADGVAHPMDDLGVLHESQRLTQAGIDLQPERGDRVEVETWRPLLEHLDIWDTPGVDHDQRDDHTAREALKQVDFALVVVLNHALAQVDQKLLRWCSESLVPFAVIVNCKSGGLDRADPRDQGNQPVYGAISAILKNGGHRPEPIGDREDGIWPCNLLWAAESLGHLAEEGREGGEAGAAGREKRRLVRNAFGDSMPNRSDLLRRSRIMAIRTMLSAYVHRPLNATGDNHSQQLHQTWQAAMLGCLQQGAK